MSQRRLFVLCFIGLGCSGSEAKDDASVVTIIDAAQPDSNTWPFTIACAAPTPNDRDICTGTADPTLIGTGVEAVQSGIQPGPTGRHWFCRPSMSAAWNGRTLLHLVGTYSDPAGDFRFAERACAQGYAAIVPMYKNRDAVRQTCAGDADCYETFHQEIIYGTPAAPTPIDVDLANSLLSRARGLATRLISGDPDFTS